MSEKEARGSLRRNNKKEKDTHADYRGSAMIDGRSYWIAGWVKTGETGDKWLSLSFKLKDDAQKPAEPRTEEGPDDEIPF